MRIQVRFYEELNDYLPPDRRKRDLFREVATGRSVRQVIEMSGVPIAAVDLILVNGSPTDLSYVLEEGDRLSVYPVFESLDITGTTPLPERPLRSPRFLAADHLGKLAKYLRMLGFDTICWKGDPALIIPTAGQVARTILSRSRGIAKHPEVTHAYQVRNEQPESQLIEVVDRFHLALQIKPLSRCLICNIPLEPIDRRRVRYKVDDRIYHLHQKFHVCPGCGRIYWYGSHAARMVSWIRNQVMLSG